MTKNILYKPCPFCNSNNVTVHDINIIQCNECKIIFTLPVYCKNSIVDLWNNENKENSDNKNLTNISSK